MKIIDLLNRIANGEDIPNFIVDDVEYYMGANGYLRECMGDDVEWYIDKEWLNTDVMVIEEKKIEKIGKHFSLHYIKTNIDEETQKEFDNTINEIYDKIDEIIDTVNELTNEE